MRSAWGGVSPSSRNSRTSLHRGNPGQCRSRTRFAKSLISTCQTHSRPARVSPRSIPPNPVKTLPNRTAVSSLSKFSPRAVASNRPAAPSRKRSGLAQLDRRGRPRLGLGWSGSAPFTVAVTPGPSAPSLIWAAAATASGINSADARPPPRSHASSASLKSHRRRHRSNPADSHLIRAACLGELGNQALIVGSSPSRQRVCNESRRSQVQVQLPADRTNRYPPILS